MISLYYIHCQQPLWWRIHFRWDIPGSSAADELIASIVCYPYSNSMPSKWEKYGEIMIYHKSPIRNWGTSILAPCSPVIDPTCYLRLVVHLDKGNPLVREFKAWSAQIFRWSKRLLTFTNHLGQFIKFPSISINFPKSSAILGENSHPVAHFGSLGPPAWRGVGTIHLLDTWKSDEEKVEFPTGSISSLPRYPRFYLFRGWLLAVNLIWVHLEVSRVLFYQIFWNKCMTCYDMLWHVDRYLPNMHTTTAKLRYPAKEHNHVQLGLMQILPEL